MRRRHVILTGTGERWGNGQAPRGTQHRFRGAGRGAQKYRPQTSAGYRPAGNAGPATPVRDQVPICRTVSAYRARFCSPPVDVRWDLLDLRLAHVELRAKWLDLRCANVEEIWIWVDLRRAHVEQIRVWVHLRPTEVDPRPTLLPLPRRVIGRCATSIAACLRQLHFFSDLMRAHPIGHESALAASCGSEEILVSAIVALKWIPLPVDALNV
jgi:hypothetical protein